MKALADIHLHIIPDVDDGARDIDEALEMIDMAVSQGIGVIFATPHSFAFDYGDGTAFEEFENLKEIVTEKYPGLEMRLGTEMHCVADYLEENIEMLNKGYYPTMGGTGYVLTEFRRFGTTEEEAIFCVKRLTEAGYIPIIAHVERYEFVSTESVNKLKELGSMIQINYFSVDKELEKQIRDLANELLRERLVDMMGSDGHRLDHRPPYLGTAELYDRYPEDYIAQITYGNVKKLLLS
ncbi:MAG: hypothetical protein K6B28_10295 [Lachnospiraceae bacterium]|nr:hypothetical protein [Lachnospiraceae bacterium]